MITSDVVINISLFFCALVTGIIGLFYSYWATSFFRWTQVSYTCVTVACFYSLIVMVSTFARAKTLDVDAYSDSFLALFATVMMVRLSNLYEAVYGEGTQVRIRGRHMVIKSKLTLPDNLVGSNLQGTDIPIKVDTKAETPFGVMKHDS